MAVIDTPLGTSAFTNYSFDADSGDIFNIPAGMIGNITINCATDFTVNIVGSLTGRTTDNLIRITFGDGSDVTLNAAANADTSPYVIDANGSSLTMNISDGATVGDIDGSNLDDGGTLTVDAGNNVTVAGYVNNLGPADANITFGDGGTVTETVYGSAGDQHPGGSVFHPALRADHITHSPVSPAGHE